MPTAVKTPSGRWRVRVYVGRDENGKVKCKTITADSQREANRLANAYIAEKDILPETPSITVSEAVEQYIETCRVTGKSPSTIRGYVGVSKVIDQDLGSQPIDKLTVYGIQNWLNEQARRVAPKTVKNYWGLLTPVLGLYRPELKLNAIRLPAAREHDVVIPTDDQVTAMLDAALAAHDDNLYKVILLAAFCGLRRSEICALTWDDINRRKKTISVNKARIRNEYNRWITNPVTKTKAGKRVVTVSSDILNSLYAARNDVSQSVVPVEPDYIYNHYARTASKLGIPTRLHFLRHYHCSVLISLGYPEKYIIERLGWNSVDMIRKVYGHVISEKRDVLDLGLAKHTETLLEGKRYAYK